MRAAPATQPDAAWQRRAADRAIQHPLIDTQLTLESLARAGAAPRPRAVYLGLGLCAPGELSRAVPLDLLGLLLPAEAIRAATGAASLVVLIADRHALDNGFSAAEVEARAAALADAVARIRERCGLAALSIVRASQMHGEPGFRDALAAVRRAARPVYHDYALRQLADAIYLERRYGSLLKVGWALRGADRERRRDEIAFDRALREIHGDRISFVYCRPGRALSDEAPRVPPYVVTRREERICIDPDEDAAGKLAVAARRASPDTVDGCRRHLRGIVYAYGRDIERLPRGPLEHRIAALIDRLAPEPAGAGAGAPLIELERDAS